MIGQLNGRLIEKNPTDLLVDCSGVGYEVKISLNTFSAIGSDEAIRIYTKLIVREDAHLLYGFHTKEERDIFNLLISVIFLVFQACILCTLALTLSQARRLSGRKPRRYARFLPAWRPSRD